MDLEVDLDLDLDLRPNSINMKTNLELLPLSKHLKTIRTLPVIIIIFVGIDQ